MPDDGEVAGLLALMLLTDARRSARTDADGALVPLTEQDRTLWDTDAIAEGVALVTGSLAPQPLGPYQVQAAIAAVHDEAARVEDTDWPQILALYGVLERIAPGPMVTLNRAVAVAMVQGPEAGLDLVATVDGRLPPRRLGPCPPSGDAGRPRRRPRRLPPRRPPHHQHPRTPPPVVPRHQSDGRRDRPGEVRPATPTMSIAFASTVARWS